MTKLTSIDSADLTVVTGGANQKEFVINECASLGLDAAQAAKARYARSGLSTAQQAKMGAVYDKLGNQVGAACQKLSTQGISIPFNALPGPAL